MATSESLPQPREAIYGVFDLAKIDLVLFAGAHNLSFHIDDKDPLRVVFTFTSKNGAPDKTHKVYVKPNSKGSLWYVFNDDETKPLATPADQVTVHWRVGEANKTIYPPGTVVGEVIDEEKYWQYVETDSDGKISRLLFGMHEMWEICSPKAFLVDLSVSLDRAPYRMVSFMSETGPLAFGFIDRSDSEGFQWLMEGMARTYRIYYMLPPEVVISSENDYCMAAISKVFPRADLRLWHKEVMDNVVKKYHRRITPAGRCLEQRDRSEWTENEVHWDLFKRSWEGVLQGTNEGEVSEHWVKISDDLGPIYPEVVAECEEWMAKNLKYLVDCFSEREKVSPLAQTVQTTLKGPRKWFLLNPTHEPNLLNIVENLRRSYEEGPLDYSAYITNSV